jgi:hypothetical protein
LALGAGAGGYAALAAPPAAESIVIKKRFTQPSCDGRCIDYDLTVKSDGSVDLRTGSAVATVPKRKLSFKVSAEEYAAFAAGLAGVKPAADSGITGVCNAKTKLVEWEIRWVAPARLRACGDEATKVAAVVGEAVKALKLDPLAGVRTE